MEKLNIAELLKDCPTGMELDCTMYEDVTLIHILEGNVYPIKIKTPEGQVSLNKYGQYSNNKLAKCIIFPKGKTTWEGFQRPFKDGDIVATNSGMWIGIVNHPTITNYAAYTTWNSYSGDMYYDGIYAFERLATEEEKQKLFKAIKDNGYKWNPETKTLEKLVKPRFKVGDRIKAICNHFQYDIKELTDTHYTLEEVDYKFKYTEPISEDKNWELVPDKFDINTLKPFDNCKFSLDGGITWKYAQYWFIQEKYNTKDIDIELWQG